MWWVQGDDGWLLAVGEERTRTRGVKVGDWLERPVKGVWGVRAATKLASGNGKIHAVLVARGVGVRARRCMRGCLVEDTAVETLS